MKLNGFDVVAILPNLLDLTAGGIDGYVIAARHPERGECVTARLRTLADTEWFSGNYFSAGTPTENLRRAMADLPRRVNRNTGALLTGELPAVA